jgi:SAM-dependent methyltransferase
MTFRQQHWLRQQHWESVHRETDQELVGWFQAYPALSLSLLRSCDVNLDAPVVDIGGGSSVLVDHLLDAGYSDVTVLDLSATALALAKERLGSRSDLVTWIEADVTEHHFARAYRVWHDRAVLHFLTDEDGRARYVERLMGAVPAGGHVIIATFAPNGPEHCSGLPVRRYSEESLSQTLGPGFEPVRFEHEAHRTPGGATQEFLYGHFERRGRQDTDTMTLSTSRTMPT